MNDCLVGLLVLISYTLALTCDSGVCVSFDRLTKQFSVEVAGTMICGECIPSEFGNWVVYGADPDRARPSSFDDVIFQKAVYDAASKAYTPVAITLSEASSSCPLNRYCGLSDGAPRCLVYSQTDCLQHSDCAPGQVCSNTVCRVCTGNVPAVGGGQAAYCFFDRLYMENHPIIPWLNLVCDDKGNCWPPKFKVELLYLATALELAFTLLGGLLCAFKLIDRSARDVMASFEGQKAKHAKFDSPGEPFGLDDLQ